MDTYDKVANAVRDYWKKNYKKQVVAMFDQKYSHEKEWEHLHVLIDCDDRYDDTVIFDYDFCEGQTDIKDLKIVPLDEIINSYEIILKDNTLSRKNFETALQVIDHWCHGFRGECYKCPFSHKEMEMSSTCGLISIYGLPGNLLLRSIGRTLDNYEERRNRHGN